MTIFAITSLMFLLVFGWVLHSQRRNQQRVKTTAAQLNKTMSDVVPIVQKRHQIQFGRASTALDSSFPNGVHSAKQKTNPA